jgi:hypothetical protein
MSDGLRLVDVPSLFVDEDKAWCLVLPLEASEWSQM